MKLVVDDEITLNEAKAIVRIHRNITKVWFPFPGNTNCIRYMVQEIGEADDALMRKNRPNDVRANQKTMNVKLEVGQIAYMMLSSFIASEGEGDGIMPIMLNYLNAVSALIRATIDNNQEAAYRHLCEIAHYAGVDVEGALVEAAKNIDARKK